MLFPSIITDSPITRIILDDATAGDGAKKGTIRGKGVVNNRMSNHMFRLLEQAGVDLLDISGGFCGPYRGGSKEQGYFSDWSQTVKAAVSVPVLVTGGITQPEAARRLLETGKADLVGVGRALLKDSLWAKRAVSIEAASV